MVTTEADGALVIPEDVSRVGWDDLTKRPGAKSGTALIAGHRDDTTGTGVFGALDSVRVGDTVWVTTSTDRIRYRVTSTQTVPKDALPAEIVATAGPHRLALVTCGGSLQPGTDGRLHWTSNIIIWATPAAA